MAMGSFDGLARHLVMSHREKLTKTQIDVLMGLFIFGEMSMSEMSEYLAVSKEQATRAVAPLVDAGYVRRARKPDQRRIVEISLTEEGRRNVEKHNEIVIRDIRECLSGLSDEDRVALVEASRTAVDIIRKLRALR